MLKKIKTRENKDNGKENRLSVRGHPLNGAGPPKSPGSRTPPHRKLQKERKDKTKRKQTKR